MTSETPETEAAYGYTPVQLPGPIVTAALEVPDLAGLLSEARWLVEPIITGLEERRRTGDYRGTDIATEALLALVARADSSHPSAVPDALELTLDASTVREATYAAYLVGREAAIQAALPDGDTAVADPQADADRPTVDGLGNAIDYDAEGRIVARTPTEAAVFAIPNLEAAVGEVGNLAAALFPLLLERVNSPDGTHVDIAAITVLQIVGRMVSTEAGGLAPVDGAIDADKTSRTVVDAVAAEAAAATERQRQHMAEHHADEPSTGAYL